MSLNNFCIKFLTLRDYLEIFLVLYSKKILFKINLIEYYNLN